MADVDTIREGLLARLEQESLLSFVDKQHSQIADLPTEIFVEIVLTDASEEDRAREVIGDWLRSWDAGRIEIDWLVRSVWEIDSLGDAEVARGASGGIVAATLIPVWLKSGSKRTVVYVAITHQAEMDIRNVTGREPELAKLATAYVGSLLRRGGKSAWNPLLSRNHQLVINADLAFDLFRVLAKTA